MKISKEQFFIKAKDVGISKNLAEDLWNVMEKDHENSTSSYFSKLLFYLGALVIISAMTWFMNVGWEFFGGGGMFLIATAYAGLFTLAGSILWKRDNLKVPAGLLITIAVSMVPLAVYGLQTYFNWIPNDQSMHYPDFYSWVSDRWIVMELATIIAGMLALYFFPFPFITAPIFLAVWFFIMDIGRFLYGEEISWQKQCWISLSFGLAVMLIAFIIDRNKKQDYAFWGYLFGTLSFWGGLNGLVWEKEYGHFVRAIYLIINLGLMFASIILKRSILMVLGAIGVFIYLSYLAYTVFEDSILFPFVLSLIGLAVISLGILYQKNAEAIEKAIWEKIRK